MSKVVCSAADGSRVMLQTSRHGPSSIQSHSQAQTRYIAFMGVNAFVTAPTIGASHSDAAVRGPSRNPWDGMSVYPHTWKTTVVGCDWHPSVWWGRGGAGRSAALRSADATADGEIDLTRIGLGTRDDTVTWMQMHGRCQILAMCTLRRVSSRLFWPGQDVVEVS
jgi:hypothetical protein